MGYVDDDAEPVQLGHGHVSEVAQSGVARLGAAITDHVPAIVGQMHHAASQIKEEPQQPQLRLCCQLLSHQRHTVAGLHQAMAAGSAGGDDVLWKGRPGHVVTHVIGQVGVVSQAA